MYIIKDMGNYKINYTFTEEQIAGIIALFKQKKSIGSIASEYNRNYHTIRELLVRYKVYTPRPHKTKEYKKPDGDNVKLSAEVRFESGMTRPYYTPWRDEWSQVSHPPLAFKQMFKGPESTVKIMKHIGIIPYLIEKDEPKEPVAFSLEKFSNKEPLIRVEDFN